MQESRHEAVTRVLALAVVAILLSLFAAAVASSVDTRPFSESQKAAAAETVIQDTLWKTQTVCNGGTRTVHYACVQQGTQDTKTLEQVCSAGFDYIIMESKGAVSVQVKPKEDLTTAGCKPPLEQPSCTNGGSLRSSVSGDKGTVKYIVGVEVSGEEQRAEEAGECGSEGIVDKLRTGAAGKVLLGIPDPKDWDAALAQIGKTPGSSVLDAAFKNNVIDSASAEALARIRSNDSAIKGIEEFLQGCKGCNPKDIAEQEGLLSDLRKQNDAWKAQLQNLANAKVALAPDSPPPTGGGGPDWPTGGTGGAGGIGGGGGFGGNGTTGFGSGGLGNMLGNLLGGQGQQPPPGNQNPQQSGTCQQTTMCVRSTVYSRDTQCVDTKREECEFGCAKDGRTCAQKSDPKKCSNEPNKPKADTCDGSWEPQRNSKDCIRGWKCVSDTNTSPPVAQISCQPRVADVGMTVAVTYGCSAGTSEGDGFDTGGARSGSASVTLSNPAAGSSNVFFGVTCTQNKVSDHETCEVQVGRPGIVLVANPQSVEANATTQIGWTTSGMASCTVSSPDQPEFTERNADMTTTSGTAETDPITSTTQIVLSCTTLGGQTRQATTTVAVGE